jgi:predicted transcriptional regulator of viral defense system
VEGRWRMANSQTSSFGRSLGGSIPSAGSRHPDLALADVVAVRYGGLLPAAALREVGVTPHGLRRLCAAGVLHGIRRGVYVAGERWRAADADERYRLLVRATVLAAGHPPVLSHQSAAALHGLPTIGGWPDTVHALTPDTSGGSTASHLTGHRGPAPDAVTEIEGCRVTPLARTLVDVAVTSSFLIAVTMLDHALRVEQERQTRPGALVRPGEEPARLALTRDDLLRELETVNPRTGRRRAEHAIRFADPLSANPGETLSRVRIFQLGFEVPELQVCFPDIEGRNAYVDFWWRRVRKIGEFDGFLKYGAGSVLGDRDPGVVVWAEKKREDALRARAASFDRWGWDLALSPERFHAFLTERGVPRA